MENKQEILDLLLQALQATRELHSLKQLTYDEKSEMVTACFKGGKKRVNVSGDSGIAMIRDVLSQIV